MPLIPDSMNPTINSATSVFGAAPSKEQWVTLLMGKKLGDNNNETTFKKDDLPKNSRVLEPGSMATMDFDENRLNVHVDDEGTIKKVTHG